MLDVHAPEHGIHGFRDFFLHLFTITVGLLIAIGLEQSVEAMHHRHQRKEAEMLIREEIRENRKAIQDGAAGLKTEIAGMQQIVQSLEAVSDGHAGVVSDNELQFREGPMQDSAWRTASTTGTLSYMEYGEVETFSEAYKEQDMLQTMEQSTLSDYLQLVPILRGKGGAVDAARAKEALPYARNAMGHLSGMYFIGAGTLGAYEDALK